MKEATVQKRVDERMEINRMIYGLMKSLRKKVRDNRGYMTVGSKVF